MQNGISEGDQLKVHINGLLITTPIGMGMGMVDEEQPKVKKKKKNKLIPKKPGWTQVTKKEKPPPPFEA